MSVNVAEITALADYLEALPDERFCMTDYARKAECGSVGCIAGHDVLRRGGCVEYGHDGYASFYIGGEEVYAHHNARVALGLSRDQGGMLFTPNSEGADYCAFPGEPGHISRPRAIAVLRDMARRESGDADWSIREPEAAA